MESTIFSSLTNYYFLMNYLKPKTVSEKISMNDIHFMGVAEACAIIYFEC